jgi:hypothetical protein
MLCASFAEHVVDALAAALRGDGVADVKHQLRAVAILHISGKFVAVEELLRDLAERGVKGDALRHDPWSAGADGVSAGDARAARKAKRARRAGFVDAMRVKLEQLLVSYCATRWDELDALAAANGSEELAAAEAYAAEVVANAIAAAHADRTRRSVGSMRVQADQLRKMSKSSVELAAAAVATAAQAAAAARRGRPSLLSASTRAKVRSATNKVLSMHVERKLSQQRKWAEIVEMGLEMKKRRRQSIAGAVLVRGSIDRQLVDATSSSLARRASAGRQPVLLMIGGGMSAGKSTAVKTMLSSSDFWRTHQASAVTVEADKFKMHDPVFQALTSTFHRGGGAAKLVHSHSTEAAEKLFIHAVNEARDIVFDGTMSWRPFVEQVVAMVRDGRFDYARGRGWIAPAAEGGAAVEEYFVRVATPRAAPRPAYRVEVLGVTCALDVAVARALRRTLETGRGVPLRSQVSCLLFTVTNVRESCSQFDSLPLTYLTISPCRSARSCARIASSRRVSRATSRSRTRPFSTTPRRPSRRPSSWRLPRRSTK